MTIYFSNNSKTAGFPYRPQIILDSVKSCCGINPFLVQTSTYGLIKGKCLSCGRMSNLANYVFIHKLDISVNCHSCGKQMEKSITKNGYYGLACKKCSYEIRFAEILPNASDLTLHNLLSKIPDKLNQKTPSSSTAKVMPIDKIKGNINKGILSQCVNCRKKGTEFCTGVKETKGSYHRPRYFCGSYSPENIAEYY